MYVHVLTSSEENVVNFKGRTDLKEKQRIEKEAAVVTYSTHNYWWHHCTGNFIFSLTSELL